MLHRVILSLLLAALGLAGIAFLTARQTPAVHRYTVMLPDWPAGALPIRLAFLSDTHVGSLAMPQSRLVAIVDQVNALRPDCVLLGGDYINGYPGPDFAQRRAVAVAPFAKLRPRIATFAVSGNHDVPEGRDRRISSRGMMAALRRVGAIALVNQATKCGPLTVAGMDYPWPGQSHFHFLLPAAARLGPPTLLFTHTPDAFASPYAGPFHLVVAGHTHCGQVALPWFGAMFVPTALGRRYACGLFSERGRVLIVGGGLGTSGVPLRLFTRPEILLIEVGGRRGNRAARR